MVRTEEILSLVLLPPRAEAEAEVIPPRANHTVASQAVRVAAVVTGEVAELGHQDRVITAAMAQDVLLMTPAAEEERGQ